MKQKKWKEIEHLRYKFLRTYRKDTSQYSWLIWVFHKAEKGYRVIIRKSWNSMSTYKDDVDVHDSYYKTQSLAIKKAKSFMRSHKR